jgi:hypothetical protein
VMGVLALIKLSVSSVRANSENAVESEDAILGLVCCWATNAKRLSSLQLSGSVVGMYQLNF